jgi:hypothetical protein
MITQFENCRVPGINYGHGKGDRITQPDFLQAPLLAAGQEQVRVNGDQSKLVEQKEEAAINRDSVKLINGNQKLTVMLDSCRYYIGNQTVMNIGSKFSSHIGPLTEVHASPRTMSEPTSYFETKGWSGSVTGVEVEVTGSSNSVTGMQIEMVGGSVATTGWELSMTLAETKLEALEFGTFGFKLDIAGAKNTLGLLQTKVIPAAVNLGFRAGLLPDVRFPPIVFN